MATELHNLTDLVDVNIPDASNMNFGIVVADWNHEITGALLQGAVDTLEQHGALPENIHVKKSLEEGKVVELHLSADNPNPVL